MYTDVTSVAAAGSQSWVYSPTRVIFIKKKNVNRSGKERLSSIILHKQLGSKRSQNREMVLLRKNRSGAIVPKK